MCVLAMLKSVMYQEVNGSTHVLICFYLHDRPGRVLLLQPHGVSEYKLFHVGIC